MPPPDPHDLWIEREHGVVRVCWQPYLSTGNAGNRRARAEAILRRLAQATWRCLWCRNPLPDYLRADALYCNARCRKQAARFRTP